MTCRKDFQEKKKGTLTKSAHPLNSGVGNGTRTHDNRNHNPGLYQLSYTHQKLGILGLPGRDRTCDHLLRRQVLYPTELRADRTAYMLFWYQVVGVKRFELPTSCSQSRRATRLRYTPGKMHFTRNPAKSKKTPIVFNSSGRTQFPRGRRLRPHSYDCTMSHH